MAFSVFLAVFSIAGLLISLFFFLEEGKIAHPSRNRIISKICTPEVCRMVLGTPYSKSLFGISNHVLGFLFYTPVLASAFVPLSKPVLAAFLLASWAGVAFSVYLVYVLFFRLRQVCKLCLATHALNLGIALTYAGMWLQLFA